MEGGEESPGAYVQEVQMEGGVAVDMEAMDDEGMDPNDEEMYQ